MRTIVLATQKGGTGKSTIGAHMAVEAQRKRKRPVAIIDTDPQGSLAAWWNAREAATPLFASVDVNRLSDHLDVLRGQGVDLVVIDTPPGSLPILKAVIAVADLVLIPTRPSPHDLRAIAPTLQLAQDAKKSFVFIVNAATPRSRIALDAITALEQYGKVASVVVHQRIDFAAAMVDGRTVMELNAGSRSAQEIASLWIYVNKQLR